MLVASKKRIDMPSKYYLGIDTSNYTTSVSLVDADREVVLNCKRLLPVKEGECGLRQSDALFAHTKALPILLNEMADTLGDGQILAVGVSEKPRNVEGSYMPCFLAGVSAATAAACALNAPLYTFSHQCGHLMAAIYSAKAQNVFLNGEPFVAFHLSGGTTEMLSVQYTNNAFVCEIIGATADISAGQLLDRIGVEMGLNFPCGAQIEQLALKCEQKIPKTSIKSADGKINLSGYENKIKQIYSQTNDKSFVARYVLSVVLEAIKAMISSIPQHLQGAPVLFSGGVMSCSYLKTELSKICNGYFSVPAFSSDNAAGIALLTSYKYQN